MKEQKVKVLNKMGLHARPATLVVQTAMGFNSSINIVKEETIADAKSIMGIMMLAAACGTELTIRVDGTDENEALQKMADLFNSGFGEE